MPAVAAACPDADCCSTALPAVEPVAPCLHRYNSMVDASSDNALLLQQHTVIVQLIWPSAKMLYIAVAQDVASWSTYQ